MNDNDMVWSSSFDDDEPCFENSGIEITIDYDCSDHLDQPGELRSDSLDCATIIIDDNDDDEDDDLDQPTRTRRPKGPSSPPSLTNSVPLPKPPMPDEGDW